MSNINSNRNIDGYQLGQNHVIESIWLKYKNNSQGDWIMKVKQIIQLHEKLKELQPKHILELGTGIGCSTEVMAFTCPNASIYTIEQNQKCIELAKTLIPEKTQERIYFKHIPAGVLRPIFEVNPFVNFLAYGARYDWQDYDFILIDGPGPIMAKVKNPEKEEVWETLAELPGGDLIFMLPKMKPGTLIYIDKRQSMVHLFIRHLSRYLSVEEPLTQIEDQKLWDSKRGYIIFKRNEESLREDFSDLKNSDLVYRQLQYSGYFDTNLSENKKNE